MLRPYALFARFSCSATACLFCLHCSVCFCFFDPAPSLLVLPSQSSVRASMKTMTPFCFIPQIGRPSAIPMRAAQHTTAAPLQMRPSRSKSRMRLQSRSCWREILFRAKLRLLLTTRLSKRSTSLRARQIWGPRRSLQSCPRQHAYPHLCQPTRSHGHLPTRRCQQILLRQHAPTRCCPRTRLHRRAQTHRCRPTHLRLRLPTPRCRPPLQPLRRQIHRRIR